MTGPLGAAFISGLSDDQLAALEQVAEDLMIEILTQIAERYADKMLANAGLAAGVAAPVIAAAGGISPDDFAGIPGETSAAIGQTLVPLVAEVYSSSQGAVRASMIKELNATLPAVHSLDAVNYLQRMPHVFDEVGSEFWANIQSELADGFRAGEAIPQLAERVRGAAGTTARKATLVARSSVIGAANSGSIDTARASGLEMVKEWLATPDPRTRPTHRAADGERVDLDEKFTVGGFEADHPGDYSLPPQERYNCRCTIGYVSIREPSRLPSEARPPTIITPKSVKDPNLYERVAITDPAYQMKVAELRRIAKADAPDLYLRSDLGHTEVLSEIRYWEATTGRHILPEIPDADMPKVRRLAPADARLSSMSDEALVADLRAGPDNTGPGGIAVRDITIDHAYKLKRGRLWRIDGVNYAIEMPDRPLTPREESIALRILDDLQKAHASTPRAGLYNESYFWLIGRNPADAYFARVYADPDFRSAANAADGFITFWGRGPLNGPKSRGIDADTFWHETGHNLDSVYAKPRGLGSKSLAWAKAVTDDAPISAPANMLRWTADPAKPPHDASKAVPDGVTPYGQNAPVEDFAESFMMYVGHEVGRISHPDGSIEAVTFRELFPNRAKILDKLLPEHARKSKAFNKIIRPPFEPLPAPRVIEAPSLAPALARDVSEVWGTADDPAMKLTITQLRQIVKDEHLGFSISGLKKPDIIRSIRQWERGNSRQVLPPIPKPQPTGPAAGLTWDNPDPGLLTGTGAKWAQTIPDTGPGGIVVRDLDVQAGYTVRHGRAWKVNGVGYLVETPREVISLGEQRQALDIIDSLQKMHAEIPAADRYNVQYGYYLGRNPQDGYWAQVYQRPGFRSGATAGDTTVSIWDRGVLGGPIGESEIRHETGHNFDFGFAEKTGIGSKSQAWKRAVEDDSARLVATQRPIKDFYSISIGDKAVEIDIDFSKPYPGGVTTYGKSAVAEDFAESFDLYLRGPVARGEIDPKIGNEDLWFRDIFPNRAAILDGLLPDFAKKQLADIKDRRAALRRIAAQADADARAARAAARKRQEAIDRVDRVSDATADIDELIYKRADSGIIEARLQQAIGDKALTKVEAEALRKAIATGDQAKIDAAMARIGKKHALEFEGRAGEIVSMQSIDATGQRMRGVGATSPPDGAQVRVVRRGAKWTYDGKTIRFEPILVRETTPAELAAIRQAKIDDSTKIADLVAAIRRELDAGPVSAARVGQLADRANVALAVRQSLVKAAGTPDGLKRALAAEMRKAKIKASGVVNRAAKFDPDTMSAKVGTTLDPGAKVKILETGYVGEIDGRSVILRKMLVEPVEVKPTKVELARIRQAAIDQKRAVADLLTDIAGVAANQGSVRALVSRINSGARRYGTPDVHRDALLRAAQSGDDYLAATMAEIERIGSDVELRRVGGDFDQVQAFDPAIHQAIVGTRIEPGSAVVLVRPGYAMRYGDEDIQISRAVVQPAEPGAKVAREATKVATVEGGSPAADLSIYDFAPDIPKADLDRARKIVKGDPNLRIFYEAEPYIDQSGIGYSEIASPEDYAWLRIFREEHKAAYERMAQEAQIEDNFRRFMRKEFKGVTPSKAKEEMAKALKDALVDAPIAVRVRDEASLIQRLTSGRFKSQFETRKSAGFYSPQVRADLEKAIFGLPEDLDPLRRPIYGYAMPGGLRAVYQYDTLNTYGKIQIVLKDAVRTRTTVSMADSLDYRYHVRPSNIDNPSWMSVNYSGGSDRFGRRSRDYTDAEYDGASYIEAQIHGGVTTDDIAEVIFDSAPQAKTIAALKKAGIPWRVVEPGSGNFDLIRIPKLTTATKAAREYSPLASMLLRARHRGEMVDLLVDAEVGREQILRIADELGIVIPSDVAKFVGKARSHLAREVEKISDRQIRKTELAPFTEADRRAAAEAFMRRAEAAPSIRKLMVAKPSEASQERLHRAFVDMLEGEYPGGLRITDVSAFQGAAKSMNFGGIVRDSAGDKVGYFTRWANYDKDTKKWIVYHHKFYLDAEVQGTGLASAMNRAMFEWYRRSDFDEVGTGASSIGAYTWATHGFDFKDRDDLDDFLNRAGGTIPEDAKLPKRTKAQWDAQWPELNALIDRAERGEWVSAYEFSQVGRKAGQGLGDWWIGKEFMLERGGFNGRLNLKPSLAARS